MEFAQQSKELMRTCGIGIVPRRSAKMSIRPFRGCKRLLKVRCAMPVRHHGLGALRDFVWSAEERVRTRGSCWTNALRGNSCSR